MERRSVSERPTTRDHLQVASAAAIAMSVAVVATSACSSCSLWNVAWRAAVWALGAGVAGILVSVGHRRVAHLGYFGEALLGGAAAWAAFATILYFSPFVWDSYFVGRAPYFSAALVVPSMLLGGIIALDLRVRDRRRLDRAGYAGQDLPWQHRYSFLRQVLVAATTMLLGMSLLNAWNRAVPGVVPLDERLARWSEFAETHPADPAAWLGYSQTLLEAQAWEEARHAAERAVDLDSEGAGGHEALGWAHLGLGQDTLALAHFWAAARRDTDNTRLWRDLARMAQRIGEGGR